MWNQLYSRIFTDQESTNLQKYPTVPKRKLTEAQLNNLPIFPKVKAAGTLFDKSPQMFSFSESTNAAGGQEMYWGDVGMVGFGRWPN